MQLIGRKALVTGAGKRVGKDIALALGRAGCDVFVHYSASATGAEETVNQIRSMGRVAELGRADLREVSAPAKLAEMVLERFGSLDILVNSASVYTAPGKMNAGHDLLNETVAEWELSFAVNARAPFFLIKELAPALAKSQDGNVINILDLSVSKMFLSRAAHSMSKSSLLATTHFAAKSLKGKVRVNALELGDILAPEGLNEAAKNSVNWIGTGPVTDAVLRVLLNRNQTGTVIQVLGEGTGFCS